jgi:hypothetical protein
MRRRFSRSISALAILLAGSLNCAAGAQDQVGGEFAKGLASLKRLVESERSLR